MVVPGRRWTLRADFGFALLLICFLLGTSVGEIVVRTLEQHSKAQLAAHIGDLRQLDCRHTEGTLIKASAGGARFWCLFPFD